MVSRAARSARIWRSSGVCPRGAAIPSPVRRRGPAAAVACVGARTCLPELDRNARSSASWPSISTPIRHAGTGARRRGPIGTRIRSANGPWNTIFRRCSRRRDVPAGHTVISRPTSAGLVLEIVRCWVDGRRVTGDCAADPDERSPAATQPPRSVSGELVARDRIHSCLSIVVGSRTVVSRSHPASMSLHGNKYRLGRRVGTAAGVARAHRTDVVRIYQREKSLVHCRYAVLFSCRLTAFY